MLCLPFSADWVESMRGEMFPSGREIMLISMGSIIAVILMKVFAMRF